MFASFRLCFIIPVLLITGWVDAQQNSFSLLPTLTPTYEQLIGVEEGLPNPCYEEIWLDEDGRMWLQPCTSSQSSYSIYLASFDGANTQAYNLTEHRATRSSDLATFILKGRSADGFFFGTYKHKSLYYLMLSNPELDSIAIVGLEGNYKQGEWVQQAFSSEGRIMVATVEEDLIRIYSYTRDNLTEIQSCRLANFPKAQLKYHQFNYVGETDTDWWFVRRGGPPFKINKENGEATEFTLDDFPTAYSTTINGINYFNKFFYLGKIDGHVTFSNTFAETYRLNDRQNGFEKFQYLPTGLTDTVGIVHTLYTFRDSIGNTLHSLAAETGRYSVLKDKDEKWYNYSKLANYKTVLAIHGSNFKRKAYIATPVGIRSIEIAPDQQSFKTYPDFNGCRGIVQQDDKHILAQSLGQTYRINLETDATSVWPECTWKDGFNNLLTDTSGKFWYINMKGLFCYDAEKDHCTPADFSGRGSRLIWLNDDKTEMLIIAASVPLATYNIKSGKQQFIETDWTEMSGHQINHTFKDSRGYIWIATGNGLYKYDHKKREIKVYSSDNGLPDYRSVCVFEREDGLLWIGTFDAGIIEFDPLLETVNRTIEMNDGLSNNTVVTILQDDNGYYWVGTYKGLNMLSSQGDVLASYEAQDGLTNSELNRLSALKLNDGRLLFGAVNGFNLIDPVKQRENLFGNEHLKIFASEIKAFNSEGEARNISTDIDLEQAPIVLRPSDKSFKLSFGLSNYLNTDKNKFQYRVIGSSDESWLKPEKQLINLSNLKSGKYKIEVIGKDFHGRQATQSLVVPLVVRRSFYRQSWFYALMGLVTLSLIGGYILQLRNRNLALNREVAMRAAQRQEDQKLIEKQSAVLFNMQSPSDQSDEGLANLPAPERMEKIGRKANHKDEKIGGLIEELLSLSQPGQREQKSQATNVLSLTRECFDAFRPQARLKDISYSLHSGVVESLLVNINREMYCKVVESLLNNALETSPKAGQVYVSLTKGENWLLVKVRDSGQRIEEDEIPLLFDRHYQLSNTTTMSVNGVGLALASEVARLMGGNIEVESIAGKGNIFHFRLPLEK